MGFPDDYHEENCRPSRPCRTCRIHALLKANLSEHIYKKVVKLVQECDEAVRFENLLDKPLSDYVEVLRQTTHDVLICRGITTLRKLARKRKADVLLIPNLGETKVQELEAFLKSLNLHFGMNV